MAARFDQVSDPAIVDGLLLMRRGQAFWARALGEVRDDGLRSPSLLPGRSRAHVVAQVGFGARALARLVEWARTGVETPMYESPAQRREEIEFGATLRADALRHLAAHAAVHLNVEWRDLPAEAWTHPVVTAEGRTVPVAETVWMRTRDVWVHALDLRTGYSTRDFPARLIDLLLDDLVAVWRRDRVDGDPDILLEPTDRDVTYRVLDATDTESLVVRGTAADLVGWGIGRSSRGVSTPSGELPGLAPTWT